MRIVVAVGDSHTAISQVVHPSMDTRNTMRWAARAKVLSFKTDAPCARGTAVVLEIRGL